MDRIQAYASGAVLLAAIAQAERHRLPAAAQLRALGRHRRSGVRSAAQAALAALGIEESILAPLAPELQQILGFPLTAVPRSARR